MVLKRPFLSYNGLQGGFEGLSNIWLGVGRGIGDSCVLWSGVCGRTRPLETLPFLSETP
jgi:hypothetical protein